MSDKIFVTGATGFLGSNLVRMLAGRGMDVRILIRKGSSHPFLENLAIERVSGDVTDYESIKEGMMGCDLVYHVAGFLSYRLAEQRIMHDVNVGGTENVCRAALQNNVKRMLHVSSTSAVGIPENPDHPADEDYPFDERWNRLPYMRTKRLAEETALGFIDKGLDVVSANPSTFYGAGDVKLHTGELFRNIDSGRLSAAPPGGNGVIAIDDCARGLIAVMERGKTGERYILNSENLKFIEIFNTITEVLDRPPIKKILPRWIYPFALFGAALVERTGALFGRPSKLSAGTVRMSWQFRYFDSSKARKDLGWKPSVPFKKACEEALDFYKHTGVIE